MILYSTALVAEALCKPRESGLESRLLLLHRVVVAALSARITEGVESSSAFCTDGQALDQVELCFTVAMATPWA